MSPDYQHYYRRWHDDTPAHLATMKRHFGDKLAPFLPADPGARILDVGCGMGFALEALRAAGFTRLQGIDADAAQAASSRARGFAADHVSDSVAWLQERPGQFDLVLLLDVIEHVPRAGQIPLVAAVHTALAPGGMLICTVPNANSSLASRQRYMDWTHETMFSEHSLDFLLHHGGFPNIDIRPDDGPDKRLPWLPLWRRRWWYVRGLFRLARRLQLMAELGPTEGRAAPLSLNLLGIAKK